MSESIPPSDQTDDTEVVNEPTPLERLIHEQREMDGRRQKWLAVLIGPGVIALLVIAWYVAQSARGEQQARETTVDFAAQVEAVICGNPTFAELCEEATEIIEDPENPPAPPMPEPGEPGKLGPVGPPPSDAQVARVLRPLIQPAVNEWFRSNPPEVPEGGGMNRDEIAALIAELVPTADEVASLIPVPDDGAPPPPGVPGPTCPNGARPEVVDIPSAGLFLLCPA